MFFLAGETPVGGHVSRPHFLSTSQRLAETRRRGILLGAKPPIGPLQALIARASRQVINAFVTYRPQRKLGLDRASRRHGAVDAEQLGACPVLMTGLATAADKPCCTEIPSSEVTRFRETSAPQSAPVLACVNFPRGEAVGCGWLELDRPSFANQPLIERGILAFDRANPDPPLLVVRVRPLVLAANGAISNMSAQSIPRRNPARPDVAALINAGLIEFGCIDAVQPIGRTIQPKCIAISHGNVRRQTWSDHRQQQRYKENKCVQPYRTVAIRVSVPEAAGPLPVN